MFPENSRYLEENRKKRERHPILDELGIEDKNLAEVFNSFLYDRLPPKMKMVVNLKLSKYSNKQIALIMGITEVTVSEHLSKAIRRFRNICYQYQEEKDEPELE